MNTMKFAILFNTIESLAGDVPLVCDVCNATSEHDARATFARVTSHFPADVIDVVLMDRPDVTRASDRIPSRHTYIGSIDARTDAHSPTIVAYVVPPLSSPRTRPQRVRYM